MGGIGPVALLALPPLALLPPLAPVSMGGSTGGRTAARRATASARS